MVVAVPLIDSLQLGTQIDNEGDVRYDRYDETQQFIIEADDDNNWTINGVEYFVNIDYPMLFSDTVTISYATATAVALSVLYKDESISVTPGNTIEISNGVVTVQQSSGSTAINESEPYHYAYVNDPMGAYTLISYEDTKSDNATISAESSLWATGLPFSNKTPSWSLIEFSISGDELKMIGGWFYSNAEIHDVDPSVYTEITGAPEITESSNLIKITISEEMIFYDPGVVLDTSINTFIVPYSEKITTDSEDSINAILSIFPILMAIGLICIMIGTFVYYRS